MNRREEAIGQFVREWLRKAESDLAAAQILLLAETSEYSACAFHCQQAAEKLIKALLVQHQIEFRKTHDLQHLVALLGQAAPGLERSLAPSDWLTPFGIEFRYPGEYPDVDRATARKALETAQHVRDVVLRGLGLSDPACPNSATGADE